MIISTHKKSHPYKRQIHIDGDVWTWHISGGVGVYIRSPDNKQTFSLTSYELNSTTHDEWHGTDPDTDYSPSPSVTPSMIKDYIQKTLLQMKG